MKKQPKKQPKKCPICRHPWEGDPCGDHYACVDTLLDVFKSFKNRLTKAESQIQRIKRVLEP